MSYCLNICIRSIGTIEVEISVWLTMFSSLYRNAQPQKTPAPFLPPTTMSGFWKPGSAAPGSSVDRLPSADDLATATAITANVHACSDRRQLPIHAHKQRILYALERFQVLIVSAATGSGKTTQLPQYLAEAGWAEDGHVIGCTQPRRVAVTSVASRVAAEMRGELGQTVGYTIRFEDLTSAQTRIKYMTDGVLFREALIDPLLTKYSVIMVYI